MDKRTTLKNLSTFAVMAFSSQLHTYTGNAGSKKPCGWSPFLPTGSSVGEKEGVEEFPRDLLQVLYPRQPPRFATCTGPFCLIANFPIILRQAFRLTVCAGEAKL